MEPLLSICIPTYNRIELLRNTINSIYEGTTEEMYSLFEVIVSDNSSDHNCQSLEQEYSKYPNFFYYVTDCEGFLNSFYVLIYGKGRYLKLLNNTAILKKGALKHMIELIRSNNFNMPFIVFTDGYRLTGKVKCYNNFNDFMKGASYFTSWSTGFGIWKDDFEKVKTIPLNKFFPQTSLLSSQYYKELFVVDDINLFITQDVPKKGGYNIFKAFTVDYINIIKNLKEKGSITNDCYRYIKMATLYKFLSVRYFKTVIAKMDKFDHTNIKESILVNYSNIDYVKFILSSFWGPFRFLIREFYRKHYTQL